MTCAYRSPSTSHRSRAWRAVPQPARPHRPRRASRARGAAAPPPRPRGGHAPRRRGRAPARSRSDRARRLGPLPLSCHPPGEPVRPPGRGARHRPAPRRGGRPRARHPRRGPPRQGPRRPRRAPGCPPPKAWPPRETPALRPAAPRACPRVARRTPARRSAAALRPAYLSLDLQCFGLLGLMGMLRAGIHLELAKLLAGEPVAGKHALHGPPDDLLGPLLEQGAEGLEADPAGVAAVAPVALVLELLAGHHDLLGVDHDHEVTYVDVGRVGRLALAAEDIGD